MANYLLTAVLLLCCAAAFALSSTTNSAPFTLDTVDPDISIIAPNGGEAWYIGDTNNITWTVEETNLTPNTINLWYSLALRNTLRWPQTSPTAAPGPR